MLVKDGKAKAETFPSGLHNIFLHTLKKAEKWATKNHNVEIIYINHKDIISNPANEAKKIISFLNINADFNNMASVVDKKLHRNII